MTANQVAYWRNVETERSNRAGEGLKHTANVIAQQEADIHSAAQKETARHQKTQDIIAAGKLVTSQIQGKRDRAANLLGKALPLIGKFI